MGWVKIDDEFTDHPKIDELSDAAFRLYMAGLCYIARNLTDGIIPTSVLRRLVPRYKPTQLAELTARVWHEPGHTCDAEKCVQPPAGHVVVHGYLDRNPTRADAEEKKQKRAEAGRLGGQRSGHTRRSKSEAAAEALAQANASLGREANGEANGKQNRTPSPSPSPSKPPTPDVGTLHPSSSSPRPDDDDGNRTLARTWTILAERDLERRNAEGAEHGLPAITTTARRSAWIATAAGRCAEAYQPIAERFLQAQPDLEPRQLADLLDNPIATAIAHSPLGNRS